MNKISTIKKELDNNLFLFAAIGFFFMLFVLFIHHKYLIGWISNSDLFWTVNFIFILSIVTLNVVVFRIKIKIEKIIPLKEKEYSYQVVEKTRNSPIPEVSALEKQYIFFCNCQSFFFGFYLAWLPSLFFYFLT